MSRPSEVSTAIASLDSISDEKLKALAKSLIDEYDLARAERRTQLTLTPAAIEHYLQEPRSGIEMSDPLVTRAPAEEIFKRYIKKARSNSTTGLSARTSINPRSS